jgi:hypothetical protein
MELFFKAIAPAVLLALFAVWFAAPPVVAYRKGYPVFPWLLACGVFGVFALAFFPFQSSIESDFSRKRHRIAANVLGSVLSICGLILLIFWAEDDFRIL